MNKGHENQKYPEKYQENHQTHQNPGKAQEVSEKDTQQIPMNGFQQVLDMLRIADPQFRESLLQRLAKRDLELARSLRRDLEQLDF